MRRIAVREFSMLLALAAIWAFFAWREPVFMSERNLSLLSIELAVTATLALGMLLVLLPGQIDLSAGSGVGLTGAVAAVLVFCARRAGAAGAGDRAGRGRGGVGRDGRAGGDRTRARVHHHAGRPAGVSRPALAHDRESHRADRRGRRHESVFAADLLLPAGAGRLRARRPGRGRGDRDEPARAPAAAAARLRGGCGGVGLAAADRAGAGGVPRDPHRQRFPRRAAGAGDPGRGRRCSCT